MKIKIRNIKNCSWCWQDKAALRLIREEFKESHKKMATCLTIYLCLTELQSNKGSEDSFLAYNKTIARMAGRSVTTIKKYCNHLISLGLLFKQARRRGKQNFSNEWFLLETPNTSVNNKYPTPNANNEATPDDNYSPVVLEEKQIRNSHFSITDNNFYKRFETMNTKN